MILDRQECKMKLVWFTEAYYRKLFIFCLRQIPHRLLSLIQSEKSRIAACLSTSHCFRAMRAEPFWRKKKSCCISRLTPTNGLLHADKGKVPLEESREQWNLLLLMSAWLLLLETALSVMLFSHKGKYTQTWQQIKLLLVNCCFYVHKKLFGLHSL